MSNLIQCDGKVDFRRLRTMIENDLARKNRETENKDTDLRTGTRTDIVGKSINCLFALIVHS